MTRESRKPVEKPADSKTTVELGMRGEDVVTLPPVGTNTFDGLKTVVLITWMATLVASAVSTLELLFPPSGADWLLLVLWVTFVAVGLLVSGQACVNLLFRMFGRQRAVFDYDKFVLASTLFGLTRQRVFRVDMISEFATAGSSSSVGRRVASGITFEHAGKKVSLGFGRRSEELEWLSGELNGLLEKHRRR